MTCRETLLLLPLFVDGELDARQMRDVALHSTRCDGCEKELRGLESVQEMVADCLARAVEDIEVDVWAAIAPRLEDVSQPWLDRVRAWWADVDRMWLIRVPAYAAVVALLLFAVLRWDLSGAGDQMAAETVDNSVILSSVESDAGSVALLSEPTTNTMVLWVTDDSPMEASPAGGLP